MAPLQSRDWQGSCDQFPMSVSVPKFGSEINTSSLFLQTHCVCVVCVGVRDTHTQV